MHYQSNNSTFRAFQSSLTVKYDVFDNTFLKTAFLETTTLSCFIKIRRFNNTLPLFHYLSSYIRAFSTYEPYRTSFRTFSLYLLFLERHDAYCFFFFFEYAFSKTFQILLLNLCFDFLTGHLFLFVPFPFTCTNYSDFGAIQACSFT